MRALVVLNLCDVIDRYEGEYIGVDRGALLLAQKGIHMRFAVGDFDSIAHTDLKLIRQYAETVYTLNAMKNESDSYSAIQHCLQYGYDEIYLLGGLGGRIDHTYYNIQLAYQYPNLVHVCDANNQVYALQKGTYTIHKNGYAYISFFTNTKATITLKDFTYNITRRHLSNKDLYTLSNCIPNEEATVIIDEGLLLVLQSNDTK